MVSYDFLPGAPRRFRAPLCAGVLAVLVFGFVGVNGTAPEPLNGASSGSAGSTQSAQPPGTRILFELIGSHRNGATGVQRTEVTDNVGVGDIVEHTLSAGRPGAPDLCDFVTSQAPDPAQFLYFWQVRALVRSVSTTHTTFDVSWRRSGPRNDSDSFDDDSQTITLEPGEYRLLDYVRDRTGASPCANVQLNVRADPLPQPGLQPTLTYDVWLVHDGHGDRRVTHQTVAGRSGQVVNVDFEPLAWSSDGRNDAAHARPPVLMKVRGTLVATLRADGSLGMSVRAVRAISWGESEVRGQGQEDFRGGLGETVSLLLPTPRGRATIAADDRQFGSGLGAAARSPVIDFASFFLGTQTSLYVRVVKKD